MQHPPADAGVGLRTDAGEPGLAQVQGKGLHADRLVEVEMPDDGVLRDFDTAEALKDAPGFGPRG